MLTQISISQFTVVDALEIEVVDGLTVITGETGAGKSIMLDALGLCLGNRADPAAIRPGSDRAEVNARFAIADVPEACRWLEERDLQAQDECILRRVITREGRSRAYINGHPATLQDCAALGGLLIDIHGQHAHQSLLRRDHQRELLDAYAGQQELARSVAAAARQWRTLDEQLTTLRSARHEQADREQLLRYQVVELDELALQDDELQQLEDEQRRLENADTLQQQASTAMDYCDQHASGTRAALAELDPELHAPEAVQNIREMLKSAAIQLEEARSELQHYLATCDSNPQRLSVVQERLEAIYALARKHRVMPEALAAHHSELRSEFDAMDSSDERLEALEQELAQFHAQYTKLQAKLSDGRQKAARKLTREVGKLLGKLAMGNCSFVIDLPARENGDPHPQGAEGVELLISTNPGADPQPLGRIASGGELSRISLAVQVVAAGSSTVPSMVFDEVDVGIGGAVAEVVGRLLADMGGRAQVLCVTHLPQVASQGKQHLLVEKRGGKTNVISTLKTLTEEERVAEIARMLGGLKMTEATIEHAREMLTQTVAQKSGKKPARKSGRTAA